VKVLVINSGSSSIKFSVIDANRFMSLASGEVEKIGEPSGILSFTQQSGSAKRNIGEAVQVPNHEEGFALVFQTLQKAGILKDHTDLFAVGHRVVHGGKDFTSPVVITDDIAEMLDELIPLAPLHNPSNLEGIAIARRLFPEVPHIAVFDTAFHRHMPPHAYLFALPHELYREHHVRRFGFHGSSHACVTRKAAEYLGIPPEGVNLITLHLGNGASAAAVQRGMSIDTSMGMTPLEGLMMGTRSGDLDPGVPFYLERRTGMAGDKLESLLYHESGLKGICDSNDMREIERRATEGDKRARLAIDMYCYRVKKYIGAYYAVLGHIDAVVFTGGIGENSPLVRASSCDGLANLGIVIDMKRNRNAQGDVAEIHAKGNSTVLVVRTDEEAEIAREAVRVLNESWNLPA